MASGIMDASPESIPPEVQAFVRKGLGADISLQPLAGDASTRRFLRACGGGRSAILMIHGEPLPADAPIFSNHRIMDEIGVPVPRILDRDGALGLVLVEDLGDLPLQKAVTTGSGAKVAHPLYAQACDLITLMQRRGSGAMRPGDFAATHALDRERFLFELGHFREFYIGRHLGRNLPAPEDDVLRRFFADLAEACDRLPRVYCHRDYQSRNLFVRDGGIHVIDFQDARMGPYTYDAASLLRDSSLDLDEDLVQVMLDRLAAGCGTPLGIGPEEFRRDFDLMAVERNLKDLGTFGYMAAQRGRSEYLSYVPRTLASVRRTLLADRRWHDAYGILDPMILR